MKILHTSDWHLGQHLITKDRRREHGLFLGWLTGVIKMVDHPRAGTLPDFGNFRIDENTNYDIYKGVKELMPFAKLQLVSLAS